MASVVAEAVSHFQWTGPFGAAFPAAVKNGIAMTAANVDKSWIGTSIEQALGAVTRTDVRAINDADAAGVAEITYGAGKGQEGVVIMTTFGTGIGTALFLHGQLVPNTELGHLEINGKDAEKGASELVREKKGLSWARWAKRVDEYLNHLEALFWPDMIIIGGGASRKADKFLPLLTVGTPVVAASLQNDAGIVGAAVVATGDVTRPAELAGAPARKTAPPARRTPAKAPATKAAPTKAAPTNAAAAKAAANAATQPATKAAPKAAPKAATKKAATKKAATRKAPASRARATNAAGGRAAASTITSSPPPPVG